MGELRDYKDRVYDDRTNEIKEIINGKIYYMSGGTFFHARIISRIIKKFNNYFDSNGNKCEVYTSDLNVFLDTENTEDFVRPDISVICGLTKAEYDQYKGTPDLIVEVASKKTRVRDRTEKLRLFEKTGVKEYWIVEPKFKLVEQYVLENGIYSTMYMTTLFDKDDETIIKSTIFEGLEIDLNEIFND